MTSSESRTTDPYTHTARAYVLLHAARGKDYAADARELDTLVRRYLPDASSLLDMACGTGDHLAGFAETFRHVVGVDASGEMLAEARRRNPSLELYEADMRTFSLAERFDVVTCLFSSVGYLLDVEELRTAVATMAAHLLPEGVLIIEGWVLPEQWQSQARPHVDNAASDELVVTRMAASRREDEISILDMHWLIGSGDGVVYVHEEHRLRLFTHEEYRFAIESAGLICTEEQGLTGRGLYVGRRSD